MSIYGISQWYSVLVRGGQWTACLIERRFPRFGSESRYKVIEMPQYSGYLHGEVLDRIEQLSKATGIPVANWP